MLQSCKRQAGLKYKPASRCTARSVPATCTYRVEVGQQILIRQSGLVNCYNCKAWQSCKVCIVFVDKTPFCSLTADAQSIQYHVPEAVLPLRRRVRFSREPFDALQSLLVSGWARHGSPTVCTSLEVLQEAYISYEVVWPARCEPVNRMSRSKRIWRR